MSTGDLNAELNSDLLKTSRKLTDEERLKFVKLMKSKKRKQHGFYQDKKNANQEIVWTLNAFKSLNIPKSKRKKLNQSDVEYNQRVLEAQTRNKLSQQLDPNRLRFKKLMNLKFKGRPIQLKGVHRCDYCDKKRLEPLEINISMSDKEKIEKSNKSQVKSNKAASAEDLHKRSDQ